MLEDKSALVVGGAGFVGSALVRRLLNDGVQSVVIVDNLLSSDIDSIPDDQRVEFVQQSINDVTADLGDDFEYMFHLATFHGNQSSIADPLADHEHNLVTTLNLCEAFAGSSKLEKFVYASAGCTVAEKTADDPVATSEDAPVSLYHDSPYQISKIVGELYLNYYWSKHDLPAVKARFQNVYGPGEVLGAGRWRGTPATVWRNVTPTFVYRALKGMPLELHSNGEASRDFIYIDDIVEGLVRCATLGQPGEVYNLSSGTETSIRRLAELIAAEVDEDVELQLLPGRPWDRSGRRYGDPRKARAEIGFEASMAIEEGVRETVAWTRKNLGRIEASVAKHEGMLETVAGR